MCAVRILQTVGYSHTKEYRLLLYMKQKLSFDMKSLLFKELTPYEVMNLTSSYYPIQQSCNFL